MIRPALIFSVLTVAFTLLMPPSVSIIGPATASADLLQCMESCIRHEGGNTASNKDTCKMRCANVPAVTGGGTPANKDSGSCMSTYKDCNEACGRNKACKRICKKALMRCQ
ncbi:MAG: hypothetical protein H8E39_14735 [Alphaproteobacteria bacterium]|nr:hypothetical protein [Alphaproteobacteria bacterium]